MSENENFSVEQEAEAVVEQEVEVKTENKKKFNVLSIVALAALGLALIMGIVGLCIDWLYSESPIISGADTLKEMFDTNKLIAGYYKGLEAILAFGIITIIAACVTAIALVLDRLFNIKALKYVTAAAAAVLIVSALLSIILTFMCTNTDYCGALKNAGVEYIPTAGAWLLSIFGVIGGILGVIGALDKEGEKCKEWSRKQTVKLKKKTQIIPFFFLLVTSVFYLLCLNDFSQSSAVAFDPVEYLGLAVFVNVLFSILVLVLFMNAFPKHPIVNKKTGKKHKINIVMLVLGFVFIAVMIFLDALYMRQLLTAVPGNESWFFKTMDEANKFKGHWSESFTANPELNSERLRPYLLKSYNFAIAHIVLLGVTVLMYALLPLYKMLLMKINTKKVLEENNIKEVIDTED